MHLARRAAVAFLMILAMLALTSCAPRVRTIARGGGHLPTQIPLTATKAELIQRVAEFYESIKSFSATVDLTPSVGSIYKGKITDYTEVTGFIDFQKPDNIRVVGLVPVVHTTLFSMVSDGKDFKVYLPVKNRFIVGANDTPGLSQNKLENIRPETFLSAMLVRPVDPAIDYTFLADETSETETTYQLHILHKVDEREFILVRRITFDRINLRITEQQTYDADGSQVSITKYTDWQVYDGVRFPSKINIMRPKDEYGVNLTITKLEMNKPIAETKFALVQPEGTELQVLGAAHPAPASPKAPQ